jgi:hypothetical protein
VIVGVGKASTTNPVVFVVVTASELLAVNLMVYTPAEAIVNVGLVAVEL